MCADDTGVSASMDAHGSINRAIFIPLYDMRDNCHRLKFITETENFNSLPQDEMQKLQWQNVREVIRYASENVPFYGKRFHEVGISWRDIRTPEDLTRIPTLTRKDIRDSGPGLLARGFETDSLVKSATGGTISSPVAVYLSRECMDMRLAATIVFNRWFGYNLGDKAVFLWGAAQDFPKLTGIRALKASIRNFFTSRIIWMPTSYLDDSILAGYYERLREYRPAVIQAYPTPLYLLAQYMAKANLSFTPRAITVVAEPLYDYQRELIESVFHLKVFNWYGSRELGHMASECRMHSGLHINAFHLYVEAISGGRQVFGSEGSLVVTDLRNKAMPLIRYEIGDVGVLSRRMCSCGSGLPLLENVSGRLVDTFVTRSGALVPGVSLTNRVIKDCLGIEQMQIIQKDFERFKIRIVKGRDFAEEDIQKLEQTLAGYYERSNLQIDYEFMNSIPLEKSGKSRFCICEVNSGGGPAGGREPA